MSIYPQILVIITILIKKFGTDNFLNNRDGKYLTHADVSLLMKQPLTQQYLAGFNDSFQRLVLTKQLERCPFSPLCNFTLGLHPETISCCKKCDCNFPQCMLRQTCCPDVIFHNLDIAGDNLFTGSDLQFLTGVEKQKSCIALVLSNNMKFNRKGTGVVGYSTCPSDTSEELSRNCSKSYVSDIETFEDITPVVSKISNETYRNKYCALCNKIENDNFKYFRKKFLCKSVPALGSERKLIKEVFNTGTCELQFISQIVLDPCTVAITKCNSTGHWKVYNPHIENACALYKSVFEVREITTTNFQNIFCSECNGISKSNLHCERNGYTEGKSGFSFSGLLRMEKSKQPNTFSQYSDRCSSDEIYDHFSGVCKKMFCPVNMDLVQGKCMDIFDSLENIMYSAIIRVIPLQKMTLNDAIVDTDHVYGYINRLVFRFGHICKAQIVLQTNLEFEEANLNESIQRTENSSFAFYDIRVELLVEGEHDPIKVMILLQSHNFSSYERSNIYEFIVIDGDEQVFKMISLISNTNDPPDLYKGNESNVRKYINKMIRDHSISGFRNQLAFPYFRSIIYDREKCLNEKKALNIIWLKPCPKVKLSSSVFPWNETIKRIVLQPGNFKLKREDFYFHDKNNLMICVSDFKDFTMSALRSISHPPSNSTILSLVCSSLSIICLAVTFIIFSILPKMRQTLPGKNNMCLVLFMLIANSLYMTSGLNILDKDSNECLIIGISVHFFWLKAIFWMNICTFHMFRVLSRTKVISQDSGKKRMICYHLFAIFMSAAFVSVNIAVSYFRSGDIGYGGQICYISSQKMINFTFVIPTACVVFSNIFMFIFVIIKIERVSSVQKHVQNERRNMNAFAKLSTITGVTWIFGLLYTWTNVSVLSYIFIILNASQGVFIMLAFVVNKRVLNLMRSLLNNTTYTGASRTSNTSLTTKY